MAYQRRGPGRASAAAMVMAVVAAVASPGIVISVGQAPGAVCVGGWSLTTSPALGGATAVDVTWLGQQPWIAGSENSEGSRPSAFTSVGTEEGWQSVPLATTSTASVLTAIAGAGANQLWAAGEAVGRKTQPLIQHWDGSVWLRANLPELPNGGALTDIASLGPTRALAVGYSTDLNGQHPLAFRWVNGVWRLSVPPVQSFGSLTAVAALPNGGAWAVGWVETVAGLRPLLQQWTGTSWRRGTLPGTGAAVLTGVTATSPTEAWAVGYRQRGSRLSALLAQWNGTAWRMIPSPLIGVTGGSILRDVTVVDGKVVTVGLAWNASSRESLPLIATRAEGTWDVVIGAGGVTGGDLIAVAGGPRLIAVGRAGSRSVAVTPCEPGHEPAPNTEGEGAVAGGAVAAGGARSPSPATSPPTVVAQTPAGEPNGGAAAPAVSAAITTRLSRPADVPGLEIRDLTEQAGLSRVTLTYSGDAADLDGDGWSDLVIPRHAKPLLVLRNEEGTFLQPFTGGYQQADRHGCAVGNIDTDPLPEIACAVGANHGLGIKSNEVWLSPLDRSGTNQAATFGVDDPLGRGRRMTLLDANHDGLLDIYVANDPSRPDGLPSMNRLFLNVDGTRFRSSPASGLDRAIGANCLVPADLDLDGWTDLIVCESLSMAGYVGLRVFHNANGTFTEVGGQLGLTSRGDLDVKVTDMDGDLVPDIVRIGNGRLQVDLQRDGLFTQVLAVPVSAAQAVTVADVNGDGRQDIYVVRGSRSAVIQDLLLLNDGTGFGFTSVILPPAQPGLGGGAIAIDYDRNGRDDLVVLHGNHLAEGPVQLLAFGPWPGGPTPTPGPSESGMPEPGGSPAVESPAASEGTLTPAPSGVNVPTPAPTDGIGGIPLPGSASASGAPRETIVMALGAAGLAALLLFGVRTRRRSGAA